MNKLFACVLIAAAVASSAVATQGMPLIADQAPSGMITQVADGCGINRYRGPDGVCRQQILFGDHYGRRPFYTCMR